MLQVIYHSIVITKLRIKNYWSTYKIENINTGTYFECYNNVVYLSTKSER